MANEQNTSSGTLPIAPTGNAVLDAFAGFTNILAQGAGIYSSFLDAKTARQVEKFQQTAPPQQVVTVPVENPWTPAQLQKAGLYAGLGIIGLVLAITIIKKVA